MSPEHGIPQMADVRGLVGIDVGVLDHDLALASIRLGRGTIRTLQRAAKKLRAVEIGVQIARSSDFQPGNPRHRAHRGSDFLGKLPWHALQKFSEFETHWRRQLTHRQTGGPCGGHIGLGAVPTGNIVGQTLAKAGFNLVVHTAPLREESK